MEVRVGERLLCLAVLSCVFFADSVLGKYVKGIVNTKEVSAAGFIWLFSLVATMTPSQTESGGKGDSTTQVSL